MPFLPDGEFWRGEPPAQPLSLLHSCDPLPFASSGSEWCWNSSAPAGGRSGCGYDCWSPCVRAAESQGQAGVEAVRIQWRFCQQTWAGHLAAGPQSHGPCRGDVVAATSWVCWKGEVSACLRSAEACSGLVLRNVSCC